MRKRFVVLSLLNAGTALVASATALAHLSVEPASMETGGKQRLVLTVHNDRDAPMTGFRLTAPEGIRILGTGGGSGWNEFVDGATARWSGSTLAPNTPATFEVDVEVTAEPGPAELQGDQLYADSEAVRWPVTLTVLPVGGSIDEGGALDATAIAILAVIGLVLAALLVVVARQRRPTLRR